MKRVKYMYYCLYFEIPKHDLDYETVCNVFPIVSHIGLTFNCFYVLFSKQKDHLYPCTVINTTCIIIILFSIV